MNKKQLRDAVQRSIDGSDKRDVEYPSSDYYRRKFDRLNVFVALLTGALMTEFPEAAALMSEFHTRVIHNQNPLLDAADSNKEKPE